MSSTSSFEPLDPNRFASGFEAQSVQARSQIEQAEVELARRRQALARETYNAAEQRFTEAEAAYRQCKAEQKDALLYLERADSHLETSLERLAETNALLHPVRKTPPEVLGIIFESCLDYLPGSSPISERQSDVRKRQLQPFYLAAVCRRWRSASLTCPRAWASLDLVLDDVSKSTVILWKDFVSCYLHRSSTRPLDIRIISRLPYTAYASRLIPLIAGEMGRCQALLVSVSEREESPVLLEPLLTAATPSLRFLHFLIHPGDVHTGLTGLFPHAPKLSRVCTLAPSLFDSTDFPNLAGVVLCSPSITEVEDNLAVLAEKYPELPSLSLVSPCIAEFHTQQKIKIGVRVLGVSQPNNRSQLDALPRVYSFPNLSILSLWGPVRASESFVSFLIQVAPVAPLLQHISIEHVASKEFARLLAALGGLPKLNSLSIRSTAIDSSGLTELCNALTQPTVRADGGAACACPCLEHIKLSTCTLASECAQEKFVEFVERRLRASADAEGPQRSQRRPLRILELPLGVDDQIRARVSELLASN